MHANIGTPGFPSFLIITALCKHTTLSCKLGVWQLYTDPCNALDTYSHYPVWTGQCISSLYGYSVHTCEPEPKKIKVMVHMNGSCTHMENECIAQFTWDGDCGYWVHHPPNTCGHFMWIERAVQVWGSVYTSQWSLTVVKGLDTMLSSLLSVIGEHLERSIESDPSPKLFSCLTEDMNSVIFSPNPT